MLASHTPLRLRVVRVQRPPFVVCLALWLVAQLVITWLLLTFTEAGRALVVELLIRAGR